ncbi:hypothetical protein [Aquimarina latercula]|uniref:hypothetical protein n=1 Tax=Aquimarina latercula TaxID=987 RepID=UPI0004264F89|nr:hypothetical protein [Aquimarina latercula]
MRDFGLDILDEEKNTSLSSQNNILTLNPKKEINQYNVCLKHFSGTDLSETKRLDFTVSVEFTGESENSYEWRINKSNFFFNQKEATLLVEEVSIFFVNTLYPLDIATNVSGEIIGIRNHSEIIERWSVIKEKLIQEYRGELILKLIKKFEKLIKNPLKLEISLSKEIFWSVFFTKRYQNYGETFKKSSLINLPLEAYQPPLSYNGFLKLIPDNSAKNPLKLIFQGSTSIPSSSKWHLNMKTDKLTSGLDIEYILDKNSKIPVNIKVFCDVFNETKKEDIIQMETLIIRDESAKLTPKTKVIIEKEEVTNENKSPKKKKKWFSFGTK